MMLPSAADGVTSSVAAEDDLRKMKADEESNAKLQFQSRSFYSSSEEEDNSDDNPESSPPPKNRARQLNSTHRSSDRQLRKTQERTRTISASSNNFDDMSSDELSPESSSSTSSSPGKKAASPYSVASHSGRYATPCYPPNNKQMWNKELGGIKKIVRSNKPAALSLKDTGRLDSTEVQMRQKALNLLREALMKRLPELPEEKQPSVRDQLDELCYAIETETWNVWKDQHDRKQKTKGYPGHFRSLANNLMDANNDDFYRGVLLGELSPESIATMKPAEMASDALQKEREEHAQALILAYENEAKQNAVYGLRGILKTHKGEREVEAGAGDDAEEAIPDEFSPLKALVMPDKLLGATEMSVHLKTDNKLPATVKHVTFADSYPESFSAPTQVSPSNSPADSSPLAGRASPDYEPEVDLFVDDSEESTGVYFPEDLLATLLTVSGNEENAQKDERYKIPKVASGASGSFSSLPSQCQSSSPSTRQKRPASFDSAREPQKKQQLFSTDYSLLPSRNHDHVVHSGDAILLNRQPALQSEPRYQHQGPNSWTDQPMDLPTDSRQPFVVAPTINSYFTDELMETLHGILSRNNDKPGQHPQTVSRNVCGASSGRQSSDIMTVKPSCWIDTKTFELYRNGQPEPERAVWKGHLVNGHRDSGSMYKKFFKVVAFRLSGDFETVDLFNDEIIKQSGLYMSKRFPIAELSKQLDNLHSLAFAVVRLKPENSKEAHWYNELYNYLIAKQRVGVCDTTRQNVHAVYIYALPREDELLEGLVDVAGTGLPFAKNRPNMLLAILFREPSGQAHSTVQESPFDPPVFPAYVSYAPPSFASPTFPSNHAYSQVPPVYAPAQPVNSQTAYASFTSYQARFTSTVPFDNGWSSMTMQQQFVEMINTGTATPLSHQQPGFSVPRTDLSSQAQLSPSTIPPGFISRSMEMSHSQPQYQF